MEFENNRILVYGAQIVAVLIAMIGVFGQKREFKSHRPTGPQTQYTGFRESDRFARLWDDPLEHLPTFKVGSPESGQTAVDRDAVTTAKATGEDDPDRSSHDPSKEDAAAPPQLDPDRRLVIMLPIGADPLPESQETRRRARYAISSAVTASGYRPADTFLHGGKVGWTGDQMAGEIDAVYEQFEQIDLGRKDVWTAKVADYQDVIVFWCPINRLDLEKHSPTSIRRKVTAFLQREKVLSPDSKYTSQNLPIEVFHMGSSDDLIAYSKHQPWKKPESVGIRVHFLRATLSNWQLKKKLEDENELPRRAVLTDDKLAKALVREMRARIPALHRSHPADRRPTIAIFTESDTAYSTAIVKELEKAWGEEVAESTDSEDEPPNPRVMVYSYLRGLDGRLESSQRQSGGAASRGPDITEAIRPGDALREKTTGTSQFDYLRMQAKRLARDKSVVAIGVLGSDVFDKILILQAVRPELPSVNFFTTDLYTTYFQSDYQEVTRNLIVASAMGLEAASSAREATGLAWHLPPMRDTYQTALVEQTWRTLYRLEQSTVDLRKETISKVSSLASDRLRQLYPFAADSLDHFREHLQEAFQDILDRPPEKLPRVFEIAAGRAIELKRLESINGNLMRQIGGVLNAVIFFGALAIGLLIVKAAMSTLPRELSPEGTQLRPWANWFLWILTIALGSVCLGIFLGFVYFWAYPDDGGLLSEPFTFTAGVSVWPSIMIRLFAFVVGVWLLRRAALAAAGELRGVGTRFQKLIPDHLTVRSPARISRMITGLFRRLLPWKQWPPRKPVRIDSVVDYLRDRRKRFWRIAVFSIAYLAFSMVIFIIWKPTVPARGDWIFLIEKIALALSVALYIVHLFYCVDLHLSALLLIRSLQAAYRENSGEAPFDTMEVLGEMGVLTRIVGKTLLYPLTILILLIVARFHIFDNWSTPPSLKITYAIAAAILVYFASRLAVETKALRQLAGKCVRENGVYSVNWSKRKLQELQKLNEGSFGPWYKQPIFIAILSFAVVFGSVGAAPALIGLLF